MGRTGAEFVGIASSKGGLGLFGSTKGSGSIRYRTAATRVRASARHRPVLKYREISGLIVDFEFIAADESPMAAARKRMPKKPVRPSTTRQGIALLRGRFPPASWVFMSATLTALSDQNRFSLLNC